MIKLTEIRDDNDKFVMRDCIINPRHIASVVSGKLSKAGPHIIGSERERELRMVTIANTNNGHLFVDETIDEIFARIAASERGASAK